MSEPIRPFSNGTEFQSWKATNCERCRLGYDREHPMGWQCQIEAAIDLASIKDGTIAPSIAKRMGYDSDTFELAWACPEKQPYAAPTTTRGAQE